MVVASFIAQGLGVGNQYLTGLFVQPFKDRFDASSAEVLFHTSGLMTLSFGVISPLYGLIARRVGLRNLLSASLFAVAVGYMLLSRATALWHVGVVYGALFSLGYLGGVLAAPALVANWFVAHRGLALGISAAGISAVGFLLPPLAEWGIVHHGWQQTSFALGISICLLQPILWRIVDRPEDRGFIDTETGLDPDVGPGWTLRRLLQSHRFWIVVIVTSIPVAVISAVLPALVSIAESHDSSSRAATYLVSTTAAVAIVGKVALGWCFDRWSQHVIALMPLMLLGGTCALLSWAPGHAQLVVASVILGAGVGATVLVLNVLAGANFGRRAFALAIGAATPVSVLLSVGCLWVIGTAFDRTGSFQPALIVFIGLLAIAGSLALALPGKRGAARAR